MASPTPPRITGAGGVKTLPDPRERPWLTVAEVAQITGEGQKAIRAALEGDQLPVLRIGRYVRIPTASFYALIGLAPNSSEAAPASGTATAPKLTLAGGVHPDGRTAAAP